MNKFIIDVENLSKLYKIGVKQERYHTLRDTLTELVSVPFRRLKQSPIRSAAYSSQSEDSLWALKDVSFGVKRGEVMGIVGRNGAGKTTLLKILSRITEPTQGRAVINGRVGSLLEVGTGFHPELTGRENIFLNGAILGMKKAEIARKFDEIVAFAEIEKFMDTPVKRYSSGMYVRLAFAVAAHLQPEILLVDEVLAVGDAAFQKKCLGKMGDVAKEGRTVVFVSHNMAAIGRLCGQCILLDNGRMVGEGPAKQVIDTYLSGGGSGEAEVEFPWDRQKTVQIRRIRLLDHKGRPALELDRTKPFRVEIEAQAHGDGPNGEVGVSLETLEGVPVCDSVSADEMEKYLSYEAGQTYRAQVEFPAAFLNAGSYRLSVNVVSNHRYLDKQWSPAFRLVNMGDFVSFVGATYSAILLVKAKWQIERNRAN